MKHKNKHNAASKSTKQTHDNIFQYIISYIIPLNSSQMLLCLQVSVTFMDFCASLFSSSMSFDWGNGLASLSRLSHWLPYPQIIPFSENGMIWGWEQLSQKQQKRSQNRQGTATMRPQALQTTSYAATMQTNQHHCCKCGCKEPQSTRCNPSVTSSHQHHRHYPTTQLWTKQETMNPSQQPGQQHQTPHHLSMTLLMLGTCTDPPYQAKHNQSATPTPQQGAFHYPAHPTTDRPPAGGQSSREKQWRPNIGVGTPPTQHQGPGGIQAAPTLYLPSLYADWPALLPKQSHASNRHNTPPMARYTTAHWPPELKSCHRHQDPMPV